MVLPPVCMAVLNRESHAYNCPACMRCPPCCHASSSLQVGNHITDRPSSRVLAPPGGASQVHFGGYDDVPPPRQVCGHSQESRTSVTLRTSPVNVSDRQGSILRIRTTHARSSLCHAKCGCSPADVRLKDDGRRRAQRHAMQFFRVSYTLKCTCDVSHRRRRRRQRASATMALPRPHARARRDAVRMTFYVRNTDAGGAGGSGGRQQPGRVPQPRARARHDAQVAGTVVAAQGA